MKPKLRILSAVFIVIFLFSCAMTAKQKYNIAYGMHVRLMGDYLDEYDRQPPEVQAVLKAKVDPVVRALDDAMIAWDAAFSADATDWTTKRSAYMAIESQLWALFLKYGVNIQEEDYR